MSNQQFLVLSSSLLGGLVAYKVWKSQSSVDKSPLPPSPKAYPIIGHLLSMPKEFEHLGFMELGQQLGTNMFSLSTFGMTIIVLNDVQDAVNLLEKRSAKYSDRTKPTMIAEPSLLDWGNFATMIGYNDRLRKYRRLMNPWLHKKAAIQFQPTQMHDARLFLQRLVDKPHDFESLKSEVYKAFASTILSSVYGYEVKSLEDPFLVDAREALHNGERALVASNFAVNLIPALVYVPEWFPGTEWKQKARQWRLQKNRAVQGIFQWTKELIKNGKGDETIVGAMIKQALSLDLSEDEADDYVQEIAFTLWAGGTDTTAASILGFFMAMMLFPDVKAKAQEEIDSVVGSERLPEMADQAQLPYVDRVVQEVLRWFPVAPLAVPHTCYEDDIYKGYKIPKGAIVIGNVWAMTRDPNVYDNPETFDPDRFLDPSVPLSPGFGWGRRQCPGQHFAEASLFIMIASFLATFDIRMPKDKDGHDIIPSKNVINSNLLYPEPYEFKLTPRSEKHQDLIRSAI